MIVYFFDIRFQLGNKLVRLILVELQDTRHLYLHKLEDIFLSHFAYKLRIERCQPFVDMFACGIHILSLFELLVLVDTLFDEDFLQRSEMQGFQRFVALDVQFLTKQRKCIVYRLTEYHTDRKEMRLLVVDDTTVGRNIHLTVGKGIQASSVLSDETPGARCTRISTLSAVLSSTFRTLILPFSIAFRIESISEEVVFRTVFH